MAKLEAATRNRLSGSEVAPDEFDDATAGAVTQRRGPQLVLL
jgi:hypothetical protein